jgi:hypothetical protein
MRFARPLRGLPFQYLPVQRRTVETVAMAEHGRAHALEDEDEELKSDGNGVTLAWE